MRFRFIFALLAVWLLLFSGRSPETAQTRDEPFHHKPIFPSDQLPAESTYTSFTFPDTVEDSGSPSQTLTPDFESSISTSNFQDKPDGQSHKLPLVLGFGLSIGALWGFRRVQKRFRLRKSRFPTKKEPVLPAFVPLLAGILVGILIAAGGLFLTSAILGLSAALFGKLSLALLCALATSAVIILIGSWIYSKTSPPPSHGFLRGCAGAALVLFIILILVPSGLALGAFSIILFIKLFLSISVSFWLGMALWLITAATFVGGFAAGLSLGVTLSFWEHEPTEKQLNRRAKRAEKRKRKTEKKKHA